MLRICFDIGTNSILSPTDPWDPPGTFQNNRKYIWTTLQGRSYDRNIRLNLFSKKEEGVLEKQMVTQIQICCISMKSISPKQFFVQSFLQNPKHQKITQKRYFIKNWLHFWNKNSKKGGLCEVCVKPEGGIEWDTSLHRILMRTDRTQFYMILQYKRYIT